MKFLSMAVLCAGLMSCSNDNSPNDPPEKINQDPPKDKTPEWAMTAVVNGNLLQMQNPLGNNFDSKGFYGIHSADPAECIVLQGRYGGTWGTPEIDMYINRADLKVGTYTFTFEDRDIENKTYIDMIDNSNDTYGNPIYEDTMSGSITITEVNTTDKTVKGTFEFTAGDYYKDEAGPILNQTVKNGTFNYKYDTK